MEIKSIILAAGRGSRLHPLTENIPKCLTELGGQSLIERQIDMLRKCDVNDIVIVTGYKSEKLALPNTRQVHNPDWASTNMVESLFCAQDCFDEDIVVSYSDIIYERQTLQALLSSPFDISVAVDRKWRPYWESRFEDPLNDAESLKMDDRGCITSVGQPVDQIEDIEAQFIGLMRFRGAGISALKAARANFDHQDSPWMSKRSVKQAYMTDLLTEIIEMGEPVHAVPIDGGWLEIDTVSDYENAVRMIADGTISDFFDPAELTY